MSPRKLISIVTPCYNEEGNVPQHFERVCNAINPYKDKYDFEHIYTDNCSEDRTFEILRELGSRHPNVKAVRFSRNIGANRAIYMGLMQAKGDAIILIQADLQDPPELIPEFIREWENGYDVAFGQIQKRREGFILGAFKTLYYQIISWLADVPPPRNAGEFRLTSRRVLDAIAMYQEEDLYLRGAVAHVGFRQKAISYERVDRKHGKTSGNILALFWFALNGLISTSTIIPIRFVISFGLLTAFGSFVYLGITVAIKLLWPDSSPHGIPTIAGLISFFSGCQLLVLGIVGEYVRKIYVQSLRRPLGFIQDKINF